MPKKKGYGSSSPRGMYSKRDNTLPKARKVPTQVGPCSNADAQKANRLLQKAQKQQDSLRGTGGRM